MAHGPRESREIIWSSPAKVSPNGTPNSVHVQQANKLIILLMMF